MKKDKLDLNCLTYGFGVYRFPRSVFHNIGQFFRNIKFAYQRITKGYADFDLWNLDYYIRAVLTKSINELADIAHGYPGVGLFSDEQAKQDGYKDGYDRWVSYLKEMSRHFANSIEDEDENSESFKLYEEMNSHIIDTIEIEKDNYTQYKCIFDNEEEYNRLQKEWLNAELEENEYRHQELKIALKMLVDNFESLWD